MNSRHHVYHLSIIHLNNRQIDIIDNAYTTKLSIVRLFQYYYRNAVLFLTANNRQIYSDVYFDIIRQFPDFLRGTAVLYKND